MLAAYDVAWFEEPLAPELVVDTERETVAESAAHVLARLAELGYVRNGGDA